MQYFLDFADSFLPVIYSIGDYLFTRKPFLDCSTVSAITAVTNTLGLNFLSDFFNSLCSPNFCPAELIVGPSLVFVLIYKLVKFFTDLVF